MRGSRKRLRSWGVLGGPDPPGPEDRRHRGPDCFMLALSCPDFPESALLTWDVGAGKMKKWDLFYFCSPHIPVWSLPLRAAIWQKERRKHAQQERQVLFGRVLCDRPVGGVRGGAARGSRLKRLKLFGAVREQCREHCPGKGAVGAWRAAKADECHKELRTRE